MEGEALNTDLPIMLSFPHQGPTKAKASRNFVTEQSSESKYVIYRLFIMDGWPGPFPPAYHTRDLWFEGSHSLVFRR